MSTVEVTKDVENPLLERREVTCSFNGIGGKLKKVEAVDMVAKELKLNKDKTVISGVFYIYDDEGLAKKHLSPVIFKRLEKAKKKEEEQKQKEEEQKQKEEEQKQKEQEQQQQQQEAESSSSSEAEGTADTKTSEEGGAENKQEASGSEEKESGDN